MISTGGYGVQVMPAINFTPGAELAGRGPGEAISGFNSGIGLVNAIQNTRQKAILSPIEVDTARARLAQIQAANQFAQQIQPYQVAQQRYDAAKTLIPIKDPNNFSIVRVPQMNADGTPSKDEQGNPIFNEMKQQSGNEINAATGASSPFQEITGVQTPSDTLALHSAYAQKARDYAEVAAQNSAIRQQLADAATKRAESDAAYKGLQGNLIKSKIDHYQTLNASGRYEFKQGTDPKTGELVVIAINKSNPSDIRNLTTGLNPIQKQDFLAALMAQQASAAPAQASTPTTSGLSSMITGIKNLFGGSSAPVDQPATLPTITADPAQAQANPDSDQISSFVNSAFDPAPPVTPVNGTQSGRYTVKPKSK